MLLRETLALRAFGLLKIPMLYWLKPTVLEMSDTRMEMKLPLTRRSKNHLGSMYFGALSAGADTASGLLAMRLIQKSKANVSLVFKDFHAEFLKRAEGDVHFVCEQGAEVRKFVADVIASGERMNLPMHITAYVPSKSKDEPVAKFILTLSLKRR